MCARVCGFCVVCSVVVTNARALYSRVESVAAAVEKEVVLPVMSREIEGLRLLGLVQQGLTPMKLCVSI